MIAVVILLHVLARMSSWRKKIYQMLGVLTFCDLAVRSILPLLRATIQLTFFKSIGPPPKRLLST